MFWDRLQQWAAHRLQLAWRCRNARLAFYRLYWPTVISATQVLQAACRAHNGRDSYVDILQEEVDVVREQLADSILESTRYSPQGTSANPFELMVEDVANVHDYGYEKDMSPGREQPHAKLAPSLYHRLVKRPWSSAGRRLPGMEVEPFPESHAVQATVETPAWADIPRPESAKFGPGNFKSTRTPSSGPALGIRRSLSALKEMQPGEKRPTIDSDFPRMSNEGEEMSRKTAASDGGAGKPIVLYNLKKNKREPQVLDLLSQVSHKLFEVTGVPIDPPPKFPPNQTTFFLDKVCFPLPLLCQPRLSCRRLASHILSRFQSSGHPRARAWPS